MRRRYILADVFTTHIFGGNPLAVFPDAEGLPVSLMQKIAAELNLSETVFVFPPESPGTSFRLRIFTPQVELPFAGHPTVGAACVLAASGFGSQAEDQNLIFEEGVGPVPVTVRLSQSSPPFAQFTAARLPEFGPPPPPIEIIAAMLSLDPEGLLAGEWTPQAVSCGVPFLFVPLASLDAAHRARLDYSLWEQALSGHWAEDIYLFCNQSETGADLHARMFAPSMGIQEDPATGAAASALAGYLAAREMRRDGLLHWSIEQGIEMGRESHLVLEADLKAGALTAVRVGGNAVILGEGVLDFSSAAQEID